MGSFPTHHRLFIMVVREYQVVGRRRPDELYPNPPIFRMRLFCPNEVVAKSKFWYIMKQTHKMKKASGEILSVIRIYERTPKKVKNFGIVCRYDSRTGTHNLYKEFRDTTRTGAVAQFYMDMASRHRARPRSIQIIAVTELKASQCKRPNITQFHDSKIKFPVIQPIERRAPSAIARDSLPSARCW